MTPLPALSNTTQELFKTASISHRQSYSTYKVNEHDFVVFGWSSHDESNEVAMRLLEMCINSNVMPVGIARDSANVECRVRTYNPDNVRKCEQESQRLFQGLVKVDYKP